MGRRAQRVAGLLVCLATAPVAADGWLFEAGAGLVGYDNVGRSRYEIDHRSATALELDASASVQPAWRTPGVVNFDLSLGAERYDRFSGLDRVRAGTGISYYDRVGLGPGAPWWSVDAQLGYTGFDDGRRSGPAWQFGATTGRAWESGFELRGRIAYRQQHADEPAFETANWRVSVDGDYRLAPRWGVFATVAWLRGEISSATTATGNFGPTAIADPVFGPAWRSYRVDATVVTLGLGATVDVGAATQLLVAWERLDGRARFFDAPYDGTLYRAQLRHEF